MKDYKLYYIGSDDHVVKRHDCSAPDDLAALEIARGLCGDCEIEVWEDSRFVSRVARDGEASLSSSVVAEHPRDAESAH